MRYEIKATSATPGLIIMLLDVSGSMSLPFGSHTRIEAVIRAFRSSLQEMLNRATKGEELSDRYHMALLAYSNQVWDLMGGIQTINKFAAKGVPDLSPMQATDTALGFLHVEKLLAKNLSKYAHCPAPIVCHLTDGEVTGADPEPIARRIMQMEVPDGHVLVENIYISDEVLKAPIPDIKFWPGITPTTSLNSTYADKLRRMSSPIPATYRATIMENGYRLDPNAVMMFPGNSYELLKLGVHVATNTDPTILHK